MTVIAEPETPATHRPVSARRASQAAKGRPLLWIAVAVALIGLVAFVSAPLLAYRAIRSAARYDDAAALAGLIDYDAVRASLRPQLIDPVGVRQAPPPPNPIAHPFAALQRMWAGRSWAPAVRQAPSPDAYLSAGGLLQVMAGQADPRHPPQPQAPASQLNIPLPSVAYFGAHRVRLVVRAGAGRHAETVLILARGRPWFDWRLVGIGLPDPANAAASAGPAR